MASETKPRGILKNTSINLQPKTPKLKWDEDNLQYTESQKSATMKITEPPTPYIRYNQETDEIMTDLETIPGLALGSSSVSPVGSMSSSSPSSAHFPDDIKDDDWSGDEDDEEAREKHRKFLQMRAQHYNMKEAIRMAHKLLEEEDDEGEYMDEWNKIKASASDRMDTR
ncbi:1619_t:CDS:2 [Paraglomus brasilianum]|uniref:1619_t:CDS:1 n=1 Tax=Paraglomus brasilianum TaxID=144538 RepID=A0A9N8ZTJ3_9GLOM|nr:1619_t:CDS:2 [Paraglomus brasilianum]